MKKLLLIITLLLTACTSITSTAIPTIQPVKIRDEINPTQVSISTPSDAQQYTFVLLGLDREGLSDAFIVANLTLDNPPHVVLVSLARELFIATSDGQQRLNAVYKLYGYDGIHNYMREVFGLEVDGVIVVNMQQFESFVDQQGGIVLIPHANVSDRCGDDEYTYQADVAYQLNGHDLLCYARMRWHSPHGYFDRQIRHFDVLQAFVNSLLQKILDDPVATYQMLDAVVDTDFESGLDVMLETVYAYLLAGQQFTLDTYSMDTNILVLLPEKPYRYVPIVNLQEWMADLLRK